MSTILGALRRCVLAPRLSEVTFRRRGFPESPADTVARLERVPQTVVCGFEWAIEAPGMWEITRRLELVEKELRGFAYEGAAMAFTLLDALPGTRGGRTRELLLGPGERYVFLAYIGIGFALARLPRALWPKAIPDLAGVAHHPTMSWLAVDGYGFDLAYFGTRRWVERREVPDPYPWDGFPGYFPRVVDQGIGRALWFVYGGRARAVADAVGGFPAHRQPDLWSGVGLASTFAGGCGREDLAQLLDTAERHRAELALGAVFTAKARSHSGFVPEHSEEAVRVLTGMSVEAAAELADRTAVHGTAGETVPAYEHWRSRIRGRFTQ